MKTIMTAGAALLMTTTMATAGGLDRSGQGIGVIFEEGDYAELSFGMVTPSVTGNITPPGLNSGNVAPRYTQLGLGYRQQINDQFAFALIIDQPFGASVDYSDADPGYPVTARAELNSLGMTMLGQYRFNENVSVHGGLRAVAVDATLNNPGTDPTTTFASDTGYGFVVGGAYEIPDIALRAAITYSSEIDMSHETTNPAVPLPGNLLGYTDYKLPQSVNLDFQTGVAEGTLLLASIRWVDWTATDINVPNPFGADADLIDYTNDSFTYTLGVARRFSDNFAGVLRVGYEESSGELASNLAPTDGSVSVSIAGIYDINENMTLTGGVTYVQLGDATAELTGAQFSDNSAIGIGFKLGYSF